MSKFREILLQYWGFDKFRDLQEEIITSVSQDKDTLALMPTGGGKSIVFQVFAMSKPGVCIVVTPLIALMKDQVENLQKRKIKAVSIHSGMTSSEIEIAFNNVCNGDYKFLYISPERLKNFHFRERLRYMNVNLLTVDEAHCISQWGYDFRPSYLEIANIRELLPDVPVLALTATATTDVVEDIQKKLGFKKQNLLKKSFERKNLVYFVINTEDKEKKLIQLMSKVDGSAVVFVRNRKKTKEYALLLRKYGFSVDFYHAGLDSAVRSEKQSMWQSGKTKIMVCTNAFGMGIDKSNVRIVVHMDFPDSLEAYFQEAGRAGRDGEKAWAFLLANKNDVIQQKRNITVSFPDINKVVEVYEAICNYLQIGFGSGDNMDYVFDIFDFAKKFKFDILTIHNVLKILEFAGVASYQEDVYSVSRVLFIVNRDDLYKFQMANQNLDEFIRLLLRTYTGVFNDYVKINEERLAVKTGLNLEDVYNLLKLLRKYKIINYIPKITKPIIHFMYARPEKISYLIDKKKLAEHKERVLKRLDAMLIYATSSNKCRSQQLLSYFGETDTYRCGNCDVCLKRNELGLSKYEFDLILDEIKKVLDEEDLMLNDIVYALDFDDAKIMQVLRWLAENNKIILSDEHKYMWNKNI